MELTEFSHLFFLSYTTLACVPVLWLVVVKTVTRTHQLQINWQMRDTNYPLETATLSRQEKRVIVARVNKEEAG